MLLVSKRTKVLKGIQRTRKNASFYSHTQKKTQKKLYFLINIPIEVMNHIIHNLLPCIK